MKRRFCIGILASLVMGGGMVRGYAETRFTESFDTPAGGVPTGWVAEMSNPPEGEAMIAEVSKASGLMALLIRRPGAPHGSAAVYYAGTPDGVSDGQLKNFSGSVLLRYQQHPKANSSTRGVVVRASALQYGKFDGYYIAIEPRGDEKGLRIYRNPKDHVDHGEQLAFDPLPSNMQMNVDYLLRFTVKDSVIEAVLSTVDDTGNPLKDVATVRIDSATPSSGYFGLRGAYGNSGPVETWFRSLHLKIE